MSTPWKLPHMLILGFSLLAPFTVAATGQTEPNEPVTSDAADAVPASAKTEPGLSAPTEVFLSGGWSTDSARPVTAISAGVPASISEVMIRMWSSYFISDADIAHSLVTEHGTSTTTVQESSGVVVEGRNIDVRQVSTGTGKVVGGAWQALTQPIGPEGFSKFDFAVLPNKTTQVLDLTKPRQFVLTFQGHTHKPCDNGQLKIIVDGQPLKYRTGQEVILTAQTSIWSFGKSVHVSLAGSCTLPNPTPTGMSLLYAGMVKVAH